MGLYYFGPWVVEPFTLSLSKGGLQGVPWLRRAQPERKVKTSLGRIYHAHWVWVALMSTSSASGTLASPDTVPVAAAPSRSTTGKPSLTRPNTA